MEFAEWLDRLAFNLQHGFDLAPTDAEQYIALVGEPYWRKRFDDGLTPEEAHNAEVDAARRAH